MNTVDEYYKRIAELAKHCSEPGWNSYDARPLSPLAVEMGKTVIESLYAPDRPTCLIWPTVYGGIMFEWTCQDKARDLDELLEIEVEPIDNDGTEWQVSVYHSGTITEFDWWDGGLLDDHRDRVEALLDAWSLTYSP